MVTELAQFHMVCVCCHELLTNSIISLITIAVMQNGVPLEDSNVSAPTPECGPHQVEWFSFVTMTIKDTVLAHSATCGGDTCIVVGIEFILLMSMAAATT